jgi:aspartyl-tRNA(Asn)/glutamyl-tRNA(Gln) amidotransferase subunit C
MAITSDDVDHIALLARLGLSPEERATFRGQLSAILEHMRTLDELDTSSIPPTAQVIPLTNVMREDEQGPSLPREAVLANAPQADGEFFRVPAVLD